MTDPSDIVNELIKRQLAAQLRCETFAARMTTAAANAVMVLHAPLHQADAQRLVDAVVLLRGTPHAGAADSVIVDPVERGAAPDPSLLDACIADEHQAIDDYRRALGSSTPWPEAVRRLLDDCQASSRARLERLMEARRALED